MQLYCGIDLHSNNSMISLIDDHDQLISEKRLNNDLDAIHMHLMPYQNDITGIVIESTYNWYWLVDGLMEKGYPVHLANTLAIQQYNGIKYTNDATDARFLAHLLRLKILPTGYIYPKAMRHVRDLLRRLQPPAWMEGGEWSYVFGCDSLGRDIVSRIIYGARISIFIGVVVVLLAEAHEWAEATWLSRWRRPFAHQHLENDQLPMVSIHVPAYNEPPEMLIETLNALALLDYPRYEVLVIDNNTVDPEVWQPVEAHCQKLGAKFRFFHVSPLAGFKAGALNFALKNTAPEAELLAVIDSDYMVTPDWLRDMAPQFATPSLAIAQAPQDYRDDGENLFKAMCYAEYKGFFYIGMLTRNERNAIIQHGTMTMVRKSVLQEVGGWAEWCITEDAELGLKIFERGYEATYIPKTYGRGLMPDTFIDFKKQRFRWAYGAVQILRRHAKALLFGRQTALTRGQRYHFVAGWIPWLADSLNLFFTVAALGWSTGMVYFPLQVDPPLVILSILPLTLFVFKVGKMIYLYRTRVGATAGQTLASALAGLSLSHTISKAILLGFFTKDKPFFRTPKRTKRHALLQALQSAREEGLIMLALWLAAICVVVVQGSETADLMVWIMVLLVQSIPYLATVIMAMVSGFAKTEEKIISSITAPLPSLPESESNA